VGCTSDFVTRIVHLEFISVALTVWESIQGMIDFGNLPHRLYSVDWNKKTIVNGLLIRILEEVFVAPFCLLPLRKNRTWKSSMKNVILVYICIISDAATCQDYVSLTKKHWGFVLRYYPDICLHGKEKSEIPQRREQVPRPLSETRISQIHAAKLVRDIVSFTVKIIAITI
jgi:hypothetical protein